jgi:sulfur relay (sulfurtransferase) DsrC/TusE family protein
MGADDVGQRALRRFTAAYDPVRDNREQCLSDRRFCYEAGAQWEGGLEEQFANRPRFEINKVHLAVIRIHNEYANNRIEPAFRPKDLSASSETANVLAGLYRADLQDSNGKEAHDVAFDEASSGGFGAWKLCAEYEDEHDPDDDRQRIRFEPIPDADQCVFFDNSSTRKDKRDAMWAFHIFSMSREAFESEFDREAPSFDQADSVTQMYDWVSNDVVKVAEYYEVELVKQTFETYKHAISGETERLAKEDEDYSEDREELIRAGYALEKTRKTKVRKVHKYRIDGAGNVLEDIGYIAGEYIPIIAVYGKRVFINGIERAMGHVRIARDPQQLYNMMVSSLAESAAESGVQVPIFTQDQIAGHETRWASHSVERLPYLTINSMTDPVTGQMMPSAPLAFTQPPVVPPAMAALIQQMDKDVAEQTGNQAQGEKLVSNVSAQAIDMVQKQVDMQAFVYMDNFADAIRHEGIVWLSMARELYDEEGRMMQAVQLDGAEDTVEIKKLVMTDDGEEYENDLQDGKYDVTVDVAPSFTSARDATVRNLLAMLPAITDPEVAGVVSSITLQQMEGEGMDDLRKWVRKRLVAQGVATPTDDEVAEAQKAAEAAQGQPPSAQDMYLQAAADKENALARKAEADTHKVLADTDKARAQTIETLLAAQGAQMQTVLQMLSAMQQAQDAQAQQIQGMAQSPIPVPADTGVQPPMMAE